MSRFRSPSSSTSAQPRVRRLAVAGLALLTSVSLVGCAASDLTPSTRWSSPAAAPSAPPSSAAAAPSAKPSTDVDYSPLLLTPADISDQQDTFALRSTTSDPNGLPGASALFVNTDDTRALSDTVALYPDAATATSTLKEAINKAGSAVVGGTPESSPVGTDGTVIRGTSPDGGKSVTLLLFTQGQALARLQFESATGDFTTDQFVTTVGKMQQIALRVGLAQQQ